MWLSKNPEEKAPGVPKSSGGAGQLKRHWSEYPEETILKDIPKKARDLAIKSFGKPDNTTYEFLDGEIGEMTQEEKSYLTEAKDDKERKKREGIVRKIGAGTINPKTGRKQYPIPLMIAAGAMIIGAVAKGISGSKKRKAQRAAMRAEQAETQANIDATKKDFVQGKIMAGQEVQAQGRLGAIEQKGAFDAFVTDAQKSVIPEGDFVKKQKGLQTGVAKQQNLLVADAMKTSANTASDMQMATTDQQNVNNARAMGELQTTNDRILASLKRSKGAIGKQIAGTKGLVNVFTDALGGASQGLGMAANIYGGGVV
jgi:hypothetical protein